MQAVPAPTLALPEVARTPAEIVLETLDIAGYPRHDTPLLQPVDPFLDLSGEDIRRRLFLTQDQAGRDLCLRPEFTIPLCRQYLADAARPAVLNAGCCGVVFRHRPGESGEFLQAGAESFGREDREAADAEIVALALEVSAALSLPNPRVRLGDMRLLELALGALGVQPAVAGRIRRELAAGRKPDLAAMASAAPANSGLERYAGVLSTLATTDQAGARAMIEDMLAIAGVQAAGGRSTAEIADRFLAKAQGAGAALPASALPLLERFLAIAGDPDHVVAQLDRFEREAGLGLGSAIRAFEERVGFLAARGVDVGSIQAATAFVRGLDYYTGLVFDLATPGIADARPLVAGGRYDRLLQRLGAAEPVPAVGCAIWVERFPAPEGVRP
jgi:ATP phosphoribosyltransferase regulatory subunit